MQPHKETERPIEMTATHPKRVDYEYERADIGSISIFVLTERKPIVRSRR